MKMQLPYSQSELKRLAYRCNLDVLTELHLRRRGREFGGGFVLARGFSKGFGEKGLQLLFVLFAESYAVRFE